MSCNYLHTTLTGIQDIQSTNAVANMDIQIKDKGITWWDVGKALRYVSTNPVVIFTSLAFTAEHIILVSGQMFLPKFVENQYFRTSGEAAIITGKWTHHYIHIYTVSHKNAPSIQDFLLSNISSLLQNVFYQLESQYCKHTLDFYEE